MHYVSTGGGERVFVCRMMFFIVTVHFLGQMHLKDSYWRNV